MSESTRQFCDCCGNLLWSTHVSSGKLESKKWTSRWFWHGDPDRRSDVDICNNCLHVIGEVVEKNREAIEAIKARSTDKPPAKLTDKYDLIVKLVVNK